MKQSFKSNTKDMRLTLCVLGLVLSLANSIVIPPTDPNIIYIGRFDMSNPNEPLFDWPGTQIQCTFTGPSIGVQLQDGNNNYYVFIDGVLQPTLVTTSETQYNYTGLSNDIHTFVLYKRTEAGSSIACSIVTFLGFELADGQQLQPTPRLTRRIALVGDSYTCGYGTESPSTVCNATQYREYENNYVAHDAVASRELCAEYQVLAYSGRGMVRNYGDPNQTSAYPVPKYFMQTLVNNETQNWNFTSWIPDVVTIFLGTNDFSTTPYPTQAEYEGTFTFMLPGSPTAPTPGFGYLNFITLVHYYYPNAQIFCLSAGTSSPGPMDQYVKDIVAKAQAAGANYVSLVELNPDIPFTGCASHPTVTTRDLGRRSC